MAAVWLLCVTLMVASCQSEDTTSLIPSNSRALMAVDVMQSGVEKMVTKMLPSIDGVDYSTPVYGFVDANGMFGVAVALDDAERVEGTLQKLQKEGKCGKMEQKFDAKWTLLKSGFLVGMKEQRMLIMGPVVAADKESLRVYMKQCFERKEEESIVGTPLFDKLSALKGGVTVVTPLSMIPSYGKVPFRLLLPAEVKSEDVLLSAVLTSGAEGMTIEGTLSSNSETVQQKLDNPGAEKITNDLMDGALYARGNAFFVLTNQKGSALLDALKSDKDLRLKLTGLNLNIDADMMLRAIRGNVALSVAVNGGTSSFSFLGVLENSEFLKDVSYWKTSLSDGVRLTDEGTNAYCLSGANMQLHFGVQEGSDGEKVLFARSKTDGAAEVAGEGVLSPGVKAAQARYTREKLVGSKLFAYMDVANILQGMGEGEKLPVVSDLPGGIGAVTIASQNGSDVTIKFWNNESETK
jgi:hypothetical protein